MPNECGYLGRDENWLHMERPPFRGHGTGANLAFVTQAGREARLGQQGEIPNRRFRDRMERYRRGNLSPG